MKYIFILVLALSLSVCSSLNTAVVKEPFTVKLDSPKIPLGTVEAHFDNLMGIGNIRKIILTVEYYPEEDAVCTQYKLDFMTYYLFWNNEGRAAYARALNQYKLDYDNRVLKSKGTRNTKRKYGKVESYLIWQAAALLKRSSASTYTELGYDIKTIDKNNVSFFSLYQREADYVEETAAKQIVTAPSIPIYLTRAKADELADLFDQDFLDSILPVPAVRKIEPLAPVTPAPAPAAPSTPLTVDEPLPSPLIEDDDNDDFDEL